MVEEWWSSVLKGDYVWVTYTLSTRVARRHGGVEVKVTIDLALVKRDLLRHVQDVKAVRGKGRGLSDHLAVQWKVRLVGAWIKRRDVMVGARMIRSEKPREHQYRERYDRSLEGKRVE